MPKLVMSAGFLCSGQWRNVTLCRPLPRCELLSGTINSDKEIVKESAYFVVLLEKRQICFKMNYSSATFQTQGNINPGWLTKMGFSVNLYLKFEI